MFLGALVLLSPWSGLPMAWLEWILLIIGLVIIAIAYAGARKKTSHALPPPPAPQSEEPQPRSSHIAFS